MSLRLAEQKTGACCTKFGMQPHGRRRRGDARRRSSTSRPAPPRQFLNRAGRPRPATGTCRSPPTALPEAHARQVRIACSTAAQRRGDRPPTGRATYHAAVRRGLRAGAVRPAPAGGFGLRALRQRARAAFLAISLRRSGLSRRFLALPPFNPPLRPMRLMYSCRSTLAIVSMLKRLKQLCKHFLCFLFDMLKRLKHNRGETSNWTGRSVRQSAEERIARPGR